MRQPLGKDLSLPHLRISGVRAGHTPSGGTGWQHPPAQAISAHHGRIIPCRPPQDCGSQGAQRHPQRYRIGDGVCAAYGPRRAARGSSSRGSKQQLGRACSTSPVGEVRLPQRKAAAAPEKMHRDVLVAEAERSKRAPTFKAHGAPPLARPSCRSAPPSRSRRRAPPHRCREGGAFPWVPQGVSTPLPPLSLQISNPEPQILLKKAFPCVNAAGKDDKRLRYSLPNPSLEPRTSP